MASPNPAVQAALPALLGFHNQVQLRHRSESEQSISSSGCSTDSAQPTSPSTPPIGRLCLVEDPPIASPSSSFSSFFPWVDADPADEERQASAKLSPRPMPIRASTTGSPRTPLRTPGLSTLFSGDLIDRTALTASPATTEWSIAPLGEDPDESDVTPSRASSTLSRPGQDHESPSESESDDDGAQHSRTKDSVELADYGEDSGEIQIPTISTTRAMVDVRHRPRPAASAAQRYDIYTDKHLPGYEVRSRRPAWPSTSFESSADGLEQDTEGDSTFIRTPRQVCGWKAVLMHPKKLEPSRTVWTDTHGKRRSKVLGQIAFEARQEPLKLHFDFRAGSGIVATMRQGHHLLRREWHISLIDGTKLTWKMTKGELALYLAPEDVQVAVFRKAPRGSRGQAAKVGRLEVTLPGQGQKRRASWYDPSISRKGEVPMDHLILASLVAIFAACGGHNRVKAGAETEDDAASPVAADAPRSDVDDFLVSSPLEVHLDEIETASPTRPVQQEGLAVDESPTTFEVRPTRAPSLLSSTSGMRIERSESTARRSLMSRIRRRSTVQERVVIEEEPSDAEEAGEDVARAPSPLSNPWLVREAQGGRQKS
ncbi:uncharacterized protein PSFLO_01092 [Pseudozyma flocculosa]|uniref:Uncharacterized protein n=1 Tax=Pseudozyma flocculosa TaxID=84751 RepID=A0A5C3EWZ9_9BASI|nr:uncharacterized protein PSFLO_01092 [Pseudozyma flocculosa]